MLKYIELKKYCRSIEEILKKYWRSIEEVLNREISMVDVLMEYCGSVWRSTESSSRIKWPLGSDNTGSNQVRLNSIQR